jgi:hypothetical protein
VFVSSIAESAGLLIKRMYGEIVTAPVVESDWNVIVCTAELPFAPATGARFVVTVMLLMFEIFANVRAADAGTIDKRPLHKAATATSAMRLVVILVDMYFLSIIRID